MNKHKLLDRQVKRCSIQTDDIPEEYQALLDMVAAAYADFEADRETIERSLELMSDELTKRNAQLRQELAYKVEVENALIQEKNEQHALIKKLEEAHNQLLQSEKLASIGQLAAGVAHEINNPIGFVSSNLSTLKTYVDHLLEATSIYDQICSKMPPSDQTLLKQMKERLDLDFLKDDAISLLTESAEGIRRVKQIVQDLKDFSHVDEAQWQWADLHKGINSTINIVNNELKYVADIEKDFGLIPDIECLPSQLNQVFLNLLVNASHAIKDKRGLIKIKTGHLSPDSIFIDVTDNGSGIPPDILKKIFDPFFTTKPVGKGTGLGLSLAYGIVNKHGGEIKVDSTVGIGTTFRIILPITQNSNHAADDLGGHH